MMEKSIDELRELGFFKGLEDRSSSQIAGALPPLQREGDLVMAGQDLFPGMEKRIRDFDLEGVYGESEFYADALAELASISRGSFSAGFGRRTASLAGKSGTLRRLGSSPDRFPGRTGVAVCGAFPCSRYVASGRLRHSRPVLRR